MTACCLLAQLQKGRGLVVISSLDGGRFFGRLPINETRIPLTNELFNHDALHLRTCCFFRFDDHALTLGSPCVANSIRAVRILAHNARWAAKLEKKRQRREAKEVELKKQAEARKQREEEEAKRKKANPFAIAGQGAKSASGGLGRALFGADSAASNPFAAPSAQDKADEGTPAGASEQGTTVDDVAAGDSSDSDGDGDMDESEDARIAEELAVKASLNDKRAQWAEADWSRDAPAYEPPQYLNTFAEPSSSARHEDDRKRNKAEMQKLKNEGLSGNEMKGWEAEKYESMLANTDDVFERFVKRVGHNGKQVVRYEFGGVPLPFHAKGAAYEKLWPAKGAGHGSTVVSGAAFSSESAPRSTQAARDFAQKGIPPCTRCGGSRVFEMQLMPNLVNTLRPSMLQGGTDGDRGGEARSQKDAEAERRREIEEALGRKLPTAPDADGITRDKVPAARSQDTSTPQTAMRRTGLLWNTAMVFVCEADCHDESSSWAEEVVEMQSEHEA